MCLAAVVRRWGDRQLATDRLDPVLASVIIDKKHHYFGLRSSSALSEKSGSFTQDLVGPLQLTIFTFQLLQQFSITLSSRVI
jgi:hypothetical protein